MMMAFLSNPCARVVMLVCLASALCVSCSTFSPRIVPPPTITYSLDAGVRPDQLWPDDQLKEVFASYWSLRFTGPWEEVFELEAPYFQEMVNPNRYRMYMQSGMRNELSEIEVRDLVQETEFFCVIHCLVRLRLANGEMNEIFLRDRWVNAGGRWYHVIQDSLIFPGVS